MQALDPAFAYMHLATVAPCFLIGAWLLAQPKGTKPHRLLGRIYALLILFAALLALLMPAEVGPRVLGHFGFIHLFSVLVLTCSPLAIRGVRRGTCAPTATMLHNPLILLNTISSGRTCSDLS